MLPLELRLYFRPVVLLKGKKVLLNQLYYAESLRSALEQYLKTDDLYSLPNVRFSHIVGFELYELVSLKKVNARYKLLKTFSLGELNKVFFSKTYTPILF